MRELYILGLRVLGFKPFKHAKRARFRDKEKQQIKEAVQQLQRESQRQILSQFMPYFESHPRDASFMLANINQEFFDHKKPDETSQQKWPGHMNKSKLSSKEISLESSSSLNPKVSKWLSTSYNTSTVWELKLRCLGFRV